MSSDDTQLWIEWIEKRVELSSMQRDYISFAIEEIKRLKIESLTKSDSVDFLIWADNNRYRTNSAGRFRKILTRGGNEDENSYTASELYDIFKEDKLKLEYGKGNS